MVKIGKTQLLMSDGTIRTFKSGAARDRFETYVKNLKKKQLVKLKKIRWKRARL
ncbi:MAG: hypothetical protein Q8M92_06950 [Candidatus Subteraquimicrobiales bacterium]|nr:hypothetical protein [Candidatus Subteraquimicrobiales bacterium]